MLGPKLYTRKQDSPLTKEPEQIVSPILKFEDISFKEDEQATSPNIAMQFKLIKARGSVLNAITLTLFNGHSFVLCFNRTCF